MPGFAFLAFRWCQMLPVPTVTQLAEFSGRPESSYSTFAMSALRQATLLMSRRTCLLAMPADADEAEMLKYGILELADDLVLKQPHQETKAKPFSAETIGSYSYSKAATRAMQGKDTGLMWFDMAVRELSVCDAAGGGDVSSSSISVFEKKGVTADASGRPQFLGPDALRDSGQYSTNRIYEVE